MDCWPVVGHCSNKQAVILNGFLKKQPVPFPSHLTSPPESTPSQSGASLRSASECLAGLGSHLQQWLISLLARVRLANFIEFNSSVTTL
ncbi:MAG TPA: hypothetical protein VFG29_12345, partial [Syntrophales bacterium]|nr:hypothetical protein [Syntrophales bacterium]